MSQRLSLGGFKWVEKTSQINGDLTKSYNDDNNIDLFLNLIFNILKIYITFTMIYPLCLKE